MQEFIKCLKAYIKNEKINKIDDDKDLINLSIERMTIIYLMLRNKQYVTTNYLISIFPNFTKKTMFNLLTKLKEIIPGEINKNKYLSYVIDLN